MTEVPSTRATEAPSSRETGTPSLATSETLHFTSVTEVSDSLATEPSPALETKAPSSLATEGPSSMATEAESFLAEVPSVSTTHIQPLLDEGPITFPTSTHIPDPESTDKEASKSSATSASPEKSLYPTMSLTQTGETLPQAQVEAEAEAEVPVSSEVLGQAQEHGGPQASLDHSGHPASHVPSASASAANATGGRTLALQSPRTGKARSPYSWLQNAGILCRHRWLGHGKACMIWKRLPPCLLPAPCMEWVESQAVLKLSHGAFLSAGAEDPEKAGLGLKHSSGHVWGPLLGLLLPSLLLAGIF